MMTKNKNVWIKKTNGWRLYSETIIMFFGWPLGTVMHRAGDIKYSEAAEKYLFRPEPMYRYELDTIKAIEEKLNELA